MLPVLLGKKKNLWSCFSEQRSIEINFRKRRKALVSGRCHVGVTHSTGNYQEHFREEAALNLALERTGSLGYEKTFCIGMPGRARHTESPTGWDECRELKSHGLHWSDRLPSRLWEMSLKKTQIGRKTSEHNFKSPAPLRTPTPPKLTLLTV